MGTCMSGLALYATKRSFCTMLCRDFLLASNILGQALSVFQTDMIPPDFLIAVSNPRKNFQWIPLGSQPSGSLLCQRYRQC